MGSFGIQLSWNSNLTNVSYSWLWYHVKYGREGYNEIKMTHEQNDFLITSQNNNGSDFFFFGNYVLYVGFGYNHRQHYISILKYKHRPRITQNSVCLMVLFQCTKQIYFSFYYNFQEQFFAIFIPCKLVYVRSTPFVHKKLKTSQH